MPLGKFQPTTKQVLQSLALQSCETQQLENNLTKVIQTKYLYFVMYGLPARMHKKKFPCSRQEERGNEKPFSYRENIELYSEEQKVLHTILG